MFDESHHEVSIGDDAVSVRRHGSSTAVVANILGMAVAEDGAPVRIWLDRLVHQPREDRLGDWEVSGAISTVLSLRAEK
jgi:hypothetical protein